ncbi:MAG: DNA recombination protein RmuC [Bifidobacteriaceae bacterium]|jgi:DNA recombination protein RmuC|nr:DNA recombination protein RmuC [Bifidobacteriaceae bacterium]MCI1979138.1 DNA recombination protein RmuC [Bifidobacteriaceae bacterium]
MFDILFLLLGVLLGGAAGYFIAKSRNGQSTLSDGQVQVLQQTLASAQKDLETSRLSEMAAKTAQQQLTEQVAYLKQQLDAQRQQEQERLQRQQEDELRKAEEKRQRENADLQEQSKILSALAPVSHNLEALQKKVTQIEESRKQEIGAVSEQLKGLDHHQEVLAKQTDSLASALRNNKVRGAWGEAQLRNIIESAGLLEHVDFDVQVSVPGEDGKTSRPDMVVHMPGGKTIPIDAKAPYQEYQQACEIPDTASPEELDAKKRHLEAHAKALRAHVKTLGERQYWKAFSITPDFVIAFIPNESLLQAALETDDGLLDYAFSQKVALTSPVTLWAVLKSVAYAWQQQSLTDDAKELFDISRELYSRFHTLGERATKLGKSITTTVQAYNSFVGTLERRVLSQARKLEKIDGSKLENVEMLDPDKSDVRQLTAPELVEGQDDDDEVHVEVHDSDRVEP